MSKTVGAVASMLPPLSIWQITYLGLGGTPDKALCHRLSLPNTRLEINQGTMGSIPNLNYLYKKL